MGPAGSNQVRLLGLESVGSLVDSSDFHHYIFFTREDLNRWGTPDKELTYACEKITVDVVLDLNQEFSLFSAALSQIVSAPLRIGFYSKEGKDYYNIMIRRQGEELAESGFKEIFQIKFLVISIFINNIYYFLHTSSNIFIKSVSVHMHAQVCKVLASRRAFTTEHKALWSETLCHAILGVSSPFNSKATILAHTIQGISLSPGTHFLLLKDSKVNF